MLSAEQSRGGDHQNRLRQWTADAVSSEDALPGSLPRATLWHRRDRALCEHWRVVRACSVGRVRVDEAFRQASETRELHHEGHLQAAGHLQGRRRRSTGLLRGLLRKQLCSVY